MDTDRKADGFSLRRWSQRKLAAKRDGRAPVDGRERAAALPAGADRPDAAPGREAPATPAPAYAPAHAVPPPMHASAAPASQSTAEAPPALPSVESLTFDSDFTAFMQPGVDENLRRGALRKLLRDPRFNVMDGLDVYIDDYSKPSPLEPEVARTLRHARYLFDPPKTRVTADGVVEDVPEDEAIEHDGAAGIAAPGASASPVPDAAAGVAIAAPHENDAVDAIATSGDRAQASNPKDGES